MTRPRVENRYGALVMIDGEMEYVVRRDQAKLLLTADQVADVRVLGGPREPVGRAYPDGSGRVLFRLNNSVQEIPFSADSLRTLEILPAGAAARALAGVEA